MGGNRPRGWAATDGLGSDRALADEAEPTRPTRYRSGESDRLETDRFRAPRRGEPSDDDPPGAAATGPAMRRAVAGRFHVRRGAQQRRQERSFRTGTDEVGRSRLDSGAGSGSGNQGRSPGHWACPGSLLESPSSLVSSIKNSAPASDARDRRSGRWSGSAAVTRGGWPSRSCRSTHRGGGADHPGSAVPDRMGRGHRCSQGQRQA